MLERIYFGELSRYEAQQFHAERDQAEDRQDRETRAAVVYRAAYEVAAGDDDDRDQVGFAAIEAAFPDLTDVQRLDLLQHVQEAIEAAPADVRRAA